MAALAAVLAIVPGWIVFVWPVALAAGILGVLGLFLQDKKKGVAIAATATALLAVVVGLGSTAISGATNPYSIPKLEAERVEGELSDGEPGSRTNPLKIGDELVGEGWTATLDSFDVDAARTATARENHLIPEHQDLSMVHITAVRTEPGSERPWDVFVVYVSRSGEETDWKDSPSGMMAWPMFPPEKVSQGEETAGYQLLPTPTSGDGLLRVKVGFYGPVYFIQPS